MSRLLTSSERVSRAEALPAYAELHCLSNFTFLRGASHPHELVEQAVALGYSALAITDECSMAGAVRAHMAAKDRPLKLIIGTELRLTCGLRFVALAIDRRGYGQLCRLITRGRRAADKGQYALTRADLDTFDPEQCHILWLPPSRPQSEELRWLAGRFCGRVRIAVELLRDGEHGARLATLGAIGAQCGVPLLASGDVHMHVRARRRLQDALTAIRLNVPIAQVGSRLYANGERYLRERARLARLYPRALLDATVELAQECHFSLDELRYEYPRELVPAGETPASYLRRLTEEGARWRWPRGVPATERTAIEHELALIEELHYEPYFLTVHDVVAFARRQGILCQGRGSAANSRVCYCLGVTSVDPQRGAALLFERFISRERNEPPDIDIDFEHERREEVLQYVYKKYGRDRAALAATVIMYRARSALRDLGKAFGLTPAESGRLAKVMQWWDGSATMRERVREAGFDAHSPWLARLLPLASELVAPDRSSSVRAGWPVNASVNVFQLALTWMAVPSGPSRLRAFCRASVRRCRLTAGPAMAANTQPHTSKASASVPPATAPATRPRPRCPLALPIIRLSSRHRAGGSVARESVALLCPTAVSRWPARGAGRPGSGSPGRTPHPPPLPPSRPGCR